MGLFRDVCGNQRCLFSIRKGAKFCPKCGMPSPAGSFKCPKCSHAFRGWAEFCPNCSFRFRNDDGSFAIDPRKLLGEAQVLGATNTWSRRPEDFAERIEVSDVQGTFFKFVVVEPGTSAIAFKDGRYVGLLPPGRYDHNGLLKRIANLDLFGKATFVLVDTGAVELALTASCKTSEMLPVEVTAGVVVQLDNYTTFFENLMRSQDRIEIGEIEERLGAEMETVCRHVVRGVGLEDLEGNIKMRDQLLEALRGHLEPSLARVGLRLLQITFLRYDSEQLKQRTGQAVLTFNLRQQTAARIAEIKSEEEVASARHQADLAGLAREEEKEEFRRGVEKKAKAHEIGIAGMDKDFEREQKRKDAETQAAVAAALQNQGLETLRKTNEEQVRHMRAVNDAEAERQARLLEVYGRATPDAIAALLGGAAGLDRIVELEKYRLFKNMSEEQILAAVAQTSPEAARALGQKYVAQAKLTEQQLQLLLAQQKIQDFHEIKGVYSETVDKMSRVATAKAGAPSGPGPACAKCGKAVGPGSSFCPHCGQAIA